MNYVCTLSETHPQQLAAARGRANNTNIGERIGELLDKVWAYVRQSGVAHTGRNVVVYYERSEEPLFFTAEGVAIEAGVIITQEFEGAGEVISSTVPGGRVVSTLHRGAYQKLPQAHRAIHAWCRENGYRLAGANWEVYGHMGDDPEALETEVFYLLA